MCPGPILSLSTCWLSHRHSSGYELLLEVARLGFEYVELSHGISPGLIPGILKGVEEKVVKVSSVHNFCPNPPGVYGHAPNVFEPSSLSFKEEKYWKVYSLKSLELAARLGAFAMVVHSGSVPFLFYNPLKKLRAFQGRQAYEKCLLKVMAKLAKKAPSYEEQAGKNITKLAELGKQMGVKIGIENRELPEELPLDTSISGFVSAIDNAYYWHDSGHAQIKEQLGIIEHETLLKQNKASLLGFHLKDVTQEGKDNQAFQDGCIDFKMLAKYVDLGHILVIEVSPALKTEAILKCKQFLTNMFYKINQDMHKSNESRIFTH